MHFLKIPAKKMSLENVIRWGMRLAILYLAAWWILLYWSFSEAITAGPLPLRQYGVAFFFGVVPHLPLWVATFSVQRVFWLLSREMAMRCGGSFRLKYL